MGGIGNLGEDSLVAALNELTSVLLQAVSWVEDTGSTSMT